MNLSRALILGLGAVLLAAGCGARQAPPRTADVPAPVQAAPAEPGPAPAPPEEPLTGSAHLVHGNALPGMGGPTPVAGSFTALLRFSAPMDRAKAEEAVRASFGRGIEARLTWQNEDKELRLEVTLAREAVLTLDPAGLPDRAGRKAQGGPALSLVGVPEVIIRRLTYIPATDEAHPFSWHQVPGVFGEGAVHPESADQLLLLGQRHTSQGLVYRAFMADAGTPRPRPLGDEFHSLYPLFYGWVPEGVVLAGDNKLKAYSTDGKLLREFPLPEGGYLHGGAVHQRTGLVAAFVSDKFTAGVEADMRLVIWNSATGEVREHGVLEKRRGTPGSDAFAWQWVDASWAPDGTRLYYAIYLQWKKDDQSSLYRIDLATGGKPQLVATGYRGPVVSPAGNGQVLVHKADRSGSAILGPDGRVAHTLPFRVWHWHLSGEALDGSVPPIAGGLEFHEHVLNYRLSDKRIQQRGIGLIIGHGPGPGGSSLISLVLTQRP